MDHALLVRSLVQHEALKLFPYTDTKGKLTIGVGRNLTNVGISRIEAFYLLDNDIERAAIDLDRALPWWRAMDDVRQRVLCEMCFNMGLETLQTFTGALASMKRGEYGDTARHMLQSLWAQQVGHRANTLAQMMKTGTDVTSTPV